VCVGLGLGVMQKQNSTKKGSDDDDEGGRPEIGVKIGWVATCQTDLPVQGMAIFYRYENMPEIGTVPKTAAEGPLPSAFCIASFTGLRFRRSETSLQPYFGSVARCCCGARGGAAVDALGGKRKKRPMQIAKQH
jgi:hypothetical protein